jgi:signal transduction histidine kinase
VANHRAAGLEVMLESGEPRPLGGVADPAAYRILQEALTNAARHSAGSARVEVAFETAAVGPIVTNPVLADGAARPGGGHGLIGMRERADLLGGTFEAGRSDGSYRVCARIPYGGRGA